MLALSKYDSAIEELRQASQRPYANVPLNYEEGFNAGVTLLPIFGGLETMHSNACNYAPLLNWLMVKAQKRWKT